MTRTKDENNAIILPHPQTSPVAAPHAARGHSGTAAFLPDLVGYKDDWDHKRDPAPFHWLMHSALRGRQ
jgi:hypothetical protein